MVKITILDLIQQSLTLGPFFFTKCHTFFNHKIDQVSHTAVFFDQVSYSTDSTKGLSTKSRALIKRNGRILAENIRAEKPQSDLNLKE